MPVPTNEELDQRLTALENAFHDYTTWVVFWDNDQGKYRYSNIGHCKYYNIQYLPTEYRCAGDAYAAARAMNA